MGASRGLTITGRNNNILRQIGEGAEVGSLRVVEEPETELERAEVNLRAECCNGAVVWEEHSGKYIKHVRFRSLGG